MAQVQRTTITLRFNGDALNPQELTERLGAVPTRSFAKGATLPSHDGAERVAKTGHWRLTLEADAPDDFETLTARLFNQLTPDGDAWLGLSQRFAGELFVGLFLGSSNEGVPISSATLAGIAAKGLGLGFDIYGPSQA